MHCDVPRYCNQGPSEITSLRQIRRKDPQQLKMESSVICPGGQYQCPDRNTCCKLPNRGYSCCPLVRASCEVMFTLLSGTYSRSNFRYCNKVLETSHLFVRSQKNISQQSKC
ncbi:hypothetical protein AVEN_162844-1 [Araneus ventricosus]|uniref:Granulins domain-containing protein n=1 Tax=Araneus ventricosus TaxID=182803 RepID=A0A4Y2C633_ARAVE|nr:hypothetical protein AVEN_162844-1 [Araneus ventricosus]